MEQVDNSNIQDKIARQNHTMVTAWEKNRAAVEEEHISLENELPDDIKNKIDIYHSKIKEQDWHEAGGGTRAKRMVSLLLENNQKEGKVLVLFVEEYVRHLINKGVSKNNILFVADTRVEACFVEGFYGLSKENVMLCKKEEGIESLFLNIKQKLCIFLYNGIYNLETMPKTNNISVIMNPPYNEGPNTVVFDKFIEGFVDEINPSLLVSIHPSKWLKGGGGLNKFRKRMLSSRQIKEIISFQDAKDVFPDNQIKGGVQIFVWEKEHDSLCRFDEKYINLNKYDIFLQEKYHNIVDKVLGKTQNYLNDMAKEVSFGKIIPTNSNLVSKGNPDNLNIRCFVSQQQKDKIWNECTVRKESVKLNQEMVGSYKVFYAMASGKGDDGFGKIFVGFPGEICTESYRFFITKNETEASNLAKYLETTFANFMLSLRKNTHIITSKTLSWIPLLPLDREWTDQDIKTYFNITKQEWDLIEERVK